MVVVFPQLLFYGALKIDSNGKRVNTAIGTKRVRVSRREDLFFSDESLPHTSHYKRPSLTCTQNCSLFVICLIIIYSTGHIACPPTAVYTINIVGIIIIYQEIHCFRGDASIPVVLK